MTVQEIKVRMELECQRLLTLSVVTDNDPEYKEALAQWQVLRDLYLEIFGDRIEAVEGL